MQLFRLPGEPTIKTYYGGTNFVKRVVWVMKMEGRDPLWSLNDFNKDNEVKTEYI